MGLNRQIKFNSRKWISLPITIILLFAINYTSAQSNVSKPITIDGVNEFFKKQMLIRTRGNLSNRPIIPDLHKEGRLFKTVEKSDWRYFKRQQRKFRNLTWKQVSKSKAILTSDQLDSLSNNQTLLTPPRCSLSLPLFTKDHKQVYVHYSWLLARNYGRGLLWIFEFIDDEWIMKKEIHLYEI